MKIVHRKKSKFLRTIRNYLANSSIHGVQYVVNSSITTTERSIWLLVLVLALLSLVSVSLQSWYRYQTRSTVVSLDRNYCFWNTTFPSTTICPLKRLNPSLYQKFISEKSHSFNEEDLSHLFDFLESLANSTFTNLASLHLTDNIDQLLEYFDIKPENYLKVIYNLTEDRSLRFINDKDNFQTIRATSGLQLINSRLILTENGLCYLFNSNLSPEYSASYMITGELLDSNLNSSELYIGTQSSTYFATGLSYNILGLNTDTPFNVYIHSPYEIMTKEKNIGYVTTSFNYHIETKEIISDKNFKENASIMRRRCRFQDENDLQHFPIYTKNLCISECRLELIYKTCNCIPHFYTNNGKQSKPICDYSKLLNCVETNKDHFLNIYSEDESSATGKDSCPCLQNCEDSFTAVVSKKSDLENMQFLTGGNSIHVSFAKMPNFRYKRSIIYTTNDWLISLGSAASLFMGICILNLLETLYHFTLHAICSFIYHRNI